MSRNDVIYSIKNLPINDRLLIVEEILKSIREDNAPSIPSYNGKNLLDFAGIITEKEAVKMEKAVEECRKIDVDEW